jgi:hypothetical protein
MTAPPPIRIPCEGSAQPGHPLANVRALLRCSMCGHLIPPLQPTNTSSITVPCVDHHDRDDIISMLQRGDFDAT